MVQPLHSVNGSEINDIVFVGLYIIVAYTHFGKTVLSGQNSKSYYSTLMTEAKIPSETSVNIP
jgi:hypothetical protein